MRVHAHKHMPTNAQELGKENKQLMMKKRHHAANHAANQTNSDNAAIVQLSNAPNAQPLPGYGKLTAALKPESGATNELANRRRRPEITPNNDAENNEPNPDIDGDGIVGEADLQHVIDEWGKQGSKADVNNDGIVNIDDLLQVLSSWGKVE